MDKKKKIMTKEKYYKAGELRDSIQFNKNKSESLKLNLKRFKDSEELHILKFECSKYEIMVYSDDIIRCMENEIIRLDNFIEDMENEFSKL